MLSRRKIFIIIFGTDTKAGKNFDIILLFLILINVLVVMMESIPSLGLQYHNTFLFIEIIFTLLFTVEYFVRIYVSPKPMRYIFSFWGFIDFLSVIPTYLSFLFIGYHYLLVVRILRLLRVFRILRLVQFNKESAFLLSAIKSSGYKILLFLLSVLFLVTILGTIMYVVEGGQAGFVSIPQSMYWAIVTVTTVGYGDLVPHTVIGKFISSFAMMLGYAIIAVPTGILTVEMSRSRFKVVVCSNCKEPNDPDAKFCKKCGQTIEHSNNLFIKE